VTLCWLGDSRVYWLAADVSGSRCLTTDDSLAEELVATGVTVDPDIAGLSTNGKTQLANGGDGLLIDGNAHGNTIGGSRRSVIPQDTFSGNSGYGIVISGRAHGNRVFASYIGTALYGRDALPNGRGGVLVAGAASDSPR